MTHGQCERETTVSLTVRRLGSEFSGGVHHVLAQQLGVGRPGRKLLVQFVVDELFYSSTWKAAGDDATETTVKPHTQKMTNHETCVN